VIDAKGDLFGTAEASNGGYGTIWELPIGSSVIKVLAAFNNADGAGPAVSS